MAILLKEEVLLEALLELALSGVIEVVRSLKVFDDHRVAEY